MTPETMRCSQSSHFVRSFIKCTHVRLIAPLLLCVLLRHHTHGLSYPLLSPPLSLRSEQSQQKLFQSNQTILFTAVRGGTGNQVYSIIQALILAHRASLTLAMPFIPARAVPEQSPRPPTGHGYPGEHLWDIDLMSHIAPVIPYSHPQAQRCSKMHVYYAAYRSTPPVHPLSPHSLPQSTRNELCARVSAMNRSLAEDLAVEHCAALALNSTVFRSKALPLSRFIDNSFIHELLTLRNRSAPPANAIPHSQPLCIFVDGVSYNFGNLTGIEYGYSYVHYLQPSAHIGNIVDGLIRRHHIVMPYLAVMHLRYDEHECFPSNPPPDAHNRICLRVKLPTRRNDTVFWAPVDLVVKSVIACLHRHRARALYIAASPYAPKSTVQKLVSGFSSRGVKVVPRVGVDLGHDLQNFVERELAVRALVFIGDFGSSWSATVHYKRRTLGRHTVWCAGLCNVTDPSYSLTGRLERPSWFEARFPQLAPLTTR